MAWMLFLLGGWMRVAVAFWVLRVAVAGCGLLELLARLAMADGPGIQRNGVACQDEINIPVNYFTSSLHKLREFRFYFSLFSRLFQ
jgi:hypothetical protein